MNYYDTICERLPPLATMGLQRLDPDVVNVDDNPFLRAVVSFASSRTANVTGSNYIIDGALIKTM